MALSPLTISANIGRSGSRFSSAISGVSSGSALRVINGNARVGADGIVIDSLPYGLSNITIRETGVDGSGRDTDFVIYGVSVLDERSTVLAALAKGQSDAQQRAAIAAGSSTFAGLQAAGLGASGTPAPVGNPLRVVGTAGEVNYLFVGAAATSANIVHEHRTRAFVGPGGVKAGTAIVSNHAFRGLPGSEPDAPGYQVRSHIEYNGLAYVSTYGGAAKGTVAAGAVDMKSDPHTGCPDIPAGALVWIVRRREYAVGDAPHYLYNTNFSPVVSGQGYNRGDGSGATAIGVAGPMPGGTGWTAIDSLYAPPVLLGEPINPSAARPFIICGASIEFANNDATGDGANGGGAYMRRALSDGGATKYPWISMAVGGEASNQFIAASTRRRAYLKYAAGGCAVNGYGGNDFTNGATPDDTWANFLTINGYFKAAGINRTAVIRPHVKSTSTDGYATTTNQSPRGNFPSWRASMDAKAAAAVADGTIGLYLDDSAAIEASGNIWKAPNYTTDGTHPEKIGHDAMYPIIRQQISNGGWL